MTETGDNSKNIPGTKFIDSHCVVEFRPTDSWEGEFGFDWFRIGDCNENINNTNTKSKYIDIVGTYKPKDPDYGDSAGSLIKDEPSKNPGKLYYADKLVKDEYTYFTIFGTNRNYIVPHLSLFFKSTVKDTNRAPNIMLYKDEASDTKKMLPSCITSATLKLIINAKNINKIYFTCPDNLEVFPNVFNNITDGKDESKTIKVSFNRLFTGSYASIKVFAVHKNSDKITFAGQLEVTKCEPKEMKVCFVRVIISPDGTQLSVQNTSWFDEQKKYMYKYFAQAHIIPTFTYAFIDLSADNIFYSKYYKRNKTPNYIITSYENSSTDREKLHEYLEEKFRQKYIDDGYFKVFIFDSYGEYNANGYILGEANNIPSKSCVIFNQAIVRTVADSTTISHELIHCLGLYHTFSNENKHTFEKLKTNNLMDYSRKTKSLNMYQWKKMQDGLR